MEDMGRVGELPSAIGFLIKDSHGSRTLCLCHFPDLFTQSTKPFNRGVCVGTEIMDGRTSVRAWQRGSVAYLSTIHSNHDLQHDIEQSRILIYMGVFVSL